MTGRYDHITDDETSVGDTPGPTSWQPVDLTDAIAGIGPEPPVIGERTDGVALFYAARVHWLQGESESLKSWIAQHTAAVTLVDGGRVLWIDFEDDEHGVVSRLKALGVPNQTITDRFTYIRPDEPLRSANGAYTTGWLHLGQVISRPYNLAVIDGVTEAMTVEGLSLLDNADIATWMRLLPKYVASVTQAPTVCIDHVTKSSDGRGRYALGGQHKLAGTTGATYKVTCTAQLSRALNEPVTGTAVLTVEKDRPGWVRARAEGDTHRIAVLEVTAYPDGGVTARLLPPDQASTAPPWSLIEKILHHLTVYDGESKNGLEKMIGGRAETAREAVKYCAAENWLTVVKVGQAHRHHLTDLGRQQLDEHS